MEAKDSIHPVERANDRFYFKRKPRNCPKCGFTPVANILYGDPYISSKLREEMDSGKTVLGGCCIEFDQPAWYCTNCETNLYKEDNADEILLL